MAGFAHFSVCFCFGIFWHFFDLLRGVLVALSMQTFESVRNFSPYAAVLVLVLLEDPILGKFKP